MHISSIRYTAWDDIDALMNAFDVLSFHSLPCTVIDFDRYSAPSVQGNIERIPTIGFFSFRGGIIFHNWSAVNESPVVMFSDAKLVPTLPGSYSSHTAAAPTFSISIPSC